MQVNLQKRKQDTQPVARQASAPIAARKRPASPAVTAAVASSPCGKLTPERIIELLRAMDARSLAKRKPKES